MVEAIRLLEEEAKRLKGKSTPSEQLTRRKQLELGLKAHQIARDGIIPQAIGSKVQIEERINSGAVLDIPVEGGDLLTVFKYTHMGSFATAAEGNRITRLNIVIQEPASTGRMKVAMRVAKIAGHVWDASAIRINIDPLSPDFGKSYQPYMGSTYGRRKTIVDLTNEPNFPNDGITNPHTQLLARILVDALATSPMLRRVQPVPAQTA